MIFYWMVKNGGRCFSDLLSTLTIKERGIISVFKLHMNMYVPVYKDLDIQKF